MAETQYNMEIANTRSFRHYAVVKSPHNIIKSPNLIHVSNAATLIVYDKCIKWLLKVLAMIRVIPLLSYPKYKASHVTTYVRPHRHMSHCDGATKSHTFCYSIMHCVDQKTMLEVQYIYIVI